MTSILLLFFGTYIMAEPQHRRTHAHAHTHTDAHMTDAHMCTHAHTCAHTHTHTHAHTHTHTHTTHTHTHTDTHTQTHTHIHNSKFLGQLKNIITSIWKSYLFFFVVVFKENPLIYRQHCVYSRKAGHINRLTSNRQPAGTMLLRFVEFATQKF